MKKYLLFDKQPVSSVQPTDGLGHPENLLNFYVHKSICGIKVSDIPGNRFPRKSLIILKKYSLIATCTQDEAALEETVLSMKTPAANAANFVIFKELGSLQVQQVVAGEDRKSVV